MGRQSSKVRFLDICPAFGLRAIRWAGFVSVCILGSILACPAYAKVSVRECPEIASLQSSITPQSEHSVPECGIQYFVGLLGDSDDEVRAFAAAALVRFGEPAVEPVLASLTKGDEVVDPRLRIGKDGQTQPRRSDYVAWILINTAAPVERQLADQLRRSREQVVEDQNPFDGDYPWSRVRAFRFILSQRGERSFPGALALLNDPDENVRGLGYAAISAAGEKATTALPILARMVDGRGEDALRAIEAASTIGAPAQGFLRRWLETSPMAEIRSEAASKIAEDEIGIETLLRTATADTDAQVREAALARLSEFEELPAGSAPLFASLAGHPTLGPMALEALAKIPAGDQRAATLAALLPIVANTPLDKDGTYSAEYLTAITGSGGRSAAMHALLLSRINAHADAGRIWATPPLIKATAAVRPVDVPTPSAVLDALLDAAPLSVIPNLSEAVAEANPDRAAVTTRLRAFLAGGLDTKLTMVRLNKDNAGQFVDYNLQDYRFAAAKLVELLIQVDPLAVSAVTSFLQRFAIDSEMHEEACSAVSIAAERAKELLEKVKPVHEAWATYCVSPVPQRPAVEIASFLVKVKAQLSTAERLQRREKGRVGSGRSSSAEWALTDDVLDPHLEKVVRGASNERAVIRAMQAEPALYRSRSLIKYVEEVAETDPEFARDLGGMLSDLSWDKIAAVTEMIENRALLGDVSAIAKRLVQRMIQNERDFRSWQKASPKKVAPLVQTILGWTASTDYDTSDVRQLLSSSNQSVRLAGARHIASTGRIAPSLSRVWPSLLHDRNQTVRLAAAQAVIGSGDLPDYWDEASTITIRTRLRLMIRKYLNEVADILRPSPLMSGRGRRLPHFPWPPPRYASRAKFGLDVDVALIGGQNTTLGSAHRRLRRALQEVDPNFEAGLFGAPGGFVILTKLEQIDRDGNPAAERWLTYRKPPADLSEYLVALFLAPPGYYRTIAFVFTTEGDFGYSTKALPAVTDGAADLPDDIAQLSLAGRAAYVLVYSFQRRDYGRPSPYNAVSAPLHLLRSGLASRLQAQ